MTLVIPCEVVQTRPALGSQCDPLDGAHGRGHLVGFEPMGRRDAPCLACEAQSSDLFKAHAPSATSNCV